MIHIDGKGDFCEINGKPVDLISELSTVMSLMFEKAPNNETRKFLKEMMHKSVDIAMDAYEYDACNKKSTEDDKTSKYILALIRKRDDDDDDDDDDEEDWEDEEWE